MKTAGYKNLGSIVGELSEMFKPPERLTVSQSAEKYRYLNNPGAYVGPWKNETTPYLTEVMDCLTDRRYNAVILAAPAQVGKTDIILNWQTHTVVCDPMDMIVYQTSQGTARDFSKRRVDRLHRHTPAVGERLMKGSDSDNVYDKHYRSGVMFTLSWPSINELSGRPVGRVCLTDYDRMPQNVDGEGSPFDLARKRTTTFRTAGKTFAESSPGFEVSDTKWLRHTSHEAPPCEGILALYNRGDRRRWHWKCPHCKHWFEPAFDLIQWPDSEEIMECADKAAMMCPHCSSLISPDLKYDLNIGGRWVVDGQRITPDDKVEGPPLRSDIASFWLKGPAAAFASWRDLVSRFLIAEQEFARTGSQEALKSTVNTDQGEAYYPRGNERERLPEDLKDTALALDDDKTVPADVRFLLACADVQKNRFCVQVFGVSPAANGFDVIAIDRIDIVKSKRRDEDGDSLWVKPATFVEDWWLLKEQVLDKVYTLADGSGVMGIKMMACDSGGRDGVTANAYSFWKQLRDKAAGEGAHKRFVLIKGDSNPSAPRVRVSYPDSSTKDRKAGARGEIPVLMLNPNILKDKLNGMLDATRGNGGFLFADYLPDEVFVEMTVERRTAKGWEKPKGSRIRNEAWDLAAYALALCAHLRVEYINWSKPPVWAAPWPENALVVSKEEENPAKQFAQRAKPVYDLASLAETLA
jgi:phage terminase large subunit GpA-like protein